MPLAGLDRREFAKLDEARQEGAEEDVEHRPPADEVDRGVDPGQLDGIAALAAPRIQEQPAQARPA
jgi:hypothetical protein